MASRSGKHPAYGRKHEQVREHLLARLAAAPGQPCPICGGPMYPGHMLDLHHTDPAAKAEGRPGDALAHAYCNRSAGMRQRHAIAAAQAAAVPVIPPPPDLTPPLLDCGEGYCRRPGQIHPNRSRCW